MKKLLSHFLAIFCAVFTALFLQFCSNAAGAPFNVCYNSEMLVGQIAAACNIKEGEKLDNFTFSSSDISVVTVDENGIVSAESKARQKYVPRKAANPFLLILPLKQSRHQSRCRPLKKAVDEGESFNLNARVNSGAYQTSFVYSSTDNSVATVSPSGRVTGVKRARQQ